MRQAFVELRKTITFEITDDDVSQMNEYESLEDVAMELAMSLPDDAWEVEDFWADVQEIDE